MQLAIYSHQWEELRLTVLMIVDMAGVKPRMQRDGQVVAPVSVTGKFICMYITNVVQTFYTILCWILLHSQNYI